MDFLAKINCLRLASRVLVFALRKGYMIFRKTKRFSKKKIGEVDLSTGAYYPKDSTIDALPLKLFFIYAQKINRRCARRKT
jgi:hypothetical protein